MSLFLFGIGLLVPLAGGRILLAPFARRLPLHKGECAALSFGAGFGLLTLCMLGLSQAGIPLAFHTIAPAVLLTALLLAHLASKAGKKPTRPIPPDVRRGRGHTERPEREMREKNPALFTRGHCRDRARRVRVLVTGLLVLVLAVSISLRYYKTYTSARTSDALGIWGIKAKVFYFEKEIPLSFFTDPEMIYTHQDYPLFLPLAEAWISFSIGQWDDRWGRLLSPTFLFFTVLGLFGFLQRWVPREVALLFCLLFCLNSTTYIHASLAQAELPLAFYYGMAVLVFVCWTFQETQEGFLWLAGFFCGMAGWVKHEGTGFFFACLLLIGMLLFFGRRKKPGRLRQFLAFLVPGLVVLLPWMSLRFFLGLQHDIVNRDTLNLTWIQSSFTRFRLVIHFFVENLFFSRNWNAFWFLLLPFAILAWRETFARPLRYLAGILLLSFLVLAFIYTITPNDPDIQLLTSFRRVTISLSLPATVLMALQSRVLLRGIPPAKEGRA